MNINPQIFRAYDIRGLVDQDLSPQVYYKLGQAYAYWLNQRRINQVVVGRDNRPNSEEYANSFIQALVDSGFQVIDIGLTLTQIIYFSGYEYKTKGMAMITASHNAIEYNGLKLGTGYSETMSPEQLQELRQLVESDTHISGQGSCTKADIYPAYLQSLLKHFQLKKKWRIVVDTCNTSSGLFYPDILRQAGCQIIEQNTTLDSSYPLGNPDPTEIGVLERLAQGVKGHQADLGLGYDADGDRMAVVDSQGQPIWMDRIIALFAQDILDYLPGSSIVYTIPCSQLVIKTITQNGGQPQMVRVGHSFVKKRVRELQAPFGGESTGHIFFMDNYFGHDDAAYASLRLLQYLERKNQTLDQAIANLPSYISSSEMKLKLTMPEEQKFDLVDQKIAPKFQQTWPEAESTTIDGLRLDLPSQMIMIRASQNGPYLTAKFEAQTPAEYQQLKQKLAEVLHQIPEIDWSQSINTQDLDL